MKNPENPFLYRYIPIPNAEAARNRLKLNKITYGKKTTLHEILCQRYGENYNAEFNQMVDPYLSLYKVNFLINQNKLWASKFQDFNDFYEGTTWCDSEFLVDELKGNKKFKAKYTHSERAHEIQKIRDLASNGYLPKNDLLNIEHGIISFCQTYNNPLMWGHYANGHWGLCVEFEPHQKLHEIITNTRSIERSLTIYDNADSAMFSHFGRINYVENPLIYSRKTKSSFNKTSLKLKTEYPNIDPRYFTTETLFSLESIMTKDIRWEYENETRFFLNYPGAIPLDKFHTTENNKPILKINSIIFGLKYSHDNPILRIIKNSATENIKQKMCVANYGSWDINLVDV